MFYPHAFAQRNITKLTRLFANERIELAEILDRPEQFLMVFRPSMVHADFGGKLPVGCRVIYSSWEGYLRNPDWVDLQSHVSTASGVFVPAHASGHIYPADLAAFVQAVNPRRVVPIHTFEPDRMRDLFPDVFLPADGETFEVSR
ncbi:MAG: hypothetical protein K8U57_11790 [Planctomycetes bacterium]|nr:hypothetical protein [Planctomycetota bacterium]